MKRIDLRRPLATSAAIALTLGLSPVLATAAPGHADDTTQSRPASDTGADNHGRARGAERYAERTIAQMSLAEKIGQLFILFAYGQTATSNDPKNSTLYGVANASEVIKKYQPGGFILFSARDNITNPTQVAKLANGLQQAAHSTGARIPLLVSTDQEQGIVTRIGPPATQFPGSMALGAGRSTKDARQAAAITGKELLAMGIQQDNAPDADVNINPDNPVIGVRSFSSHPDLVSDMVTASVKGYQNDGGIIATAKHFPGHGDTATDSHTGLPVITHTRAEWERIDAPPFRAAIKAGVDSIMTAHIVVPSLDASGDPATLSKKIVTGQLRNRLGFTGVIVTDGLEMAGVREKYGDAEVAVRALEAGVDQLLLPPDPTVAYGAVKDALGSGRLTEKRIDESVKRILVMKYNQGVIKHPTTKVNQIGSRVGTASHLKAARRITAKTPTLVKNEHHSLPVRVKGKKVLVTGYGVTTGQTLAAELAKRGATTTTLPTGTAPSAADRVKALAAAKSSDITVVLTNNVAAESTQQQFVKDLLATGGKVVVAGVRNPYDIAQLPSATNFIATYSYSPVAIVSLARVITGEIKPKGKLPVDIPTAEDPDQVLYPFGYGLSW